MSEALDERDRLDSNLAIVGKELGQVLSGGCHLCCDISGRFPVGPVALEHDFVQLQRLEHPVHQLSLKSQRFRSDKKVQSSPADSWPIFEFESVENQLARHRPSEHCERKESVLQPCFVLPDQQHLLTIDRDPVALLGHLEVFDQSFYFRCTGGDATWFH